MSDEPKAILDRLRAQAAARKAAPESSPTPAPKKAGQAASQRLLARVTYLTKALTQNTVLRERLEREVQSLTGELAKTRAKYTDAVRQEGAAK